MNGLGKLDFFFILQWHTFKKLVQIRNGIGFHSERTIDFLGHLDIKNVVLLKFYFDIKLVAVTIYSRSPNDTCSAGFSFFMESFMLIGSVKVVSFDLQIGIVWYYPNGVYRTLRRQCHFLKYNWEWRKWTDRQSRTECLRSRRCFDFMSSLEIFVLDLRFISSCAGTLCCGF